MLSDDFCAIIPWTWLGSEINRAWRTFHGWLHARWGLEEFRKVMQTHDCVSGLHNFWEFSQPPEWSEISKEINCEGKQISLGSNFRIPRNSFTCHWIRIASIVLCLDLQSLPTHVSEAEMSCGVFWSLAKSWNTSVVYWVKSVTTARKLPITQLCHKSTFLSKSKITN